MNEKDENNIPEPDRPLLETENTVFDDDGTVISHTEQTITDPPRSRRVHPGVIAATISAAGLILLLVWYFALRDSSAGRPVPAPRSTAMDDLPAGEPMTRQTLTITPEQLATSGISIETVGEQLAAEVGLTASTGVIEANAYRNTPALALVGGVVRAVPPELGENVNRGQTVAVVFSNEFAEAQSRYIALQTETENARQNYERTQRLVGINQPGRTELDQAAKQLKAAEAALAEMQNRYQRTTRLIKIGAASREELEQDNTKLRTAEAEVTEARRRHERAGRLVEINPETRTQNEEALNKLRSSESELATSRQRLILYGMSPDRVSSLRNASQVTSELAVLAPIGGTVTSRTVNAGEVVEANKELLRVTDLSNVWVIAQVFEQDLPRLRVGSGASVTTGAFPNRLFRGHVTYIDPAIDQATRTAKVRVELVNPDRALKLGMYVNVAFGSLGQSERTVAVIPSTALQTFNSRQVVFIATADPTVFEMRPVRVGAEINGRYPVIEGLNVGDRIVTRGSFMLRAEWQKAQQSSQGHESHGS
ncbi:MAG: efflux RND transporter periplasmic adaptor subunit [Acidobacteria bacterium]|nr:efflux RND transporter periplasmic adaptor subunit [Acidobacteriota bacterium]